MAFPAEPTNFVDNDMRQIFLALKEINTNITTSSNTRRRSLLIQPSITPPDCQTAMTIAINSILPYTYDFFVETISVVVNIGAGGVPRFLEIVGKQDGIVFSTEFIQACNQITGIAAGTGNVYFTLCKNLPDEEFYTNASGFLVYNLYVPEMVFIAGLNGQLSFIIRNAEPTDTWVATGCGIMGEAVEKQ